MRKLITFLTRTGEKSTNRVWVNPDNIVAFEIKPINKHLEGGKSEVDYYDLNITSTRFQITSIPFNVEDLGIVEEYLSSWGDDNGTNN